MLTKLAKEHQRKKTILREDNGNVTSKGFGYNLFLSEINVLEKLRKATADSVIVMTDKMMDSINSDVSLIFSNQVLFLQIYKILKFRN